MMNMMMKASSAVIAVIGVCLFSSVSFADGDEPVNPMKRFQIMEYRVQK